VSEPREKAAAETREVDAPAIVPVLPLRGTVLFPLQVASVLITSKTNLHLLEEHPGADEIVAAGAVLDPEGSLARRNLSTAAVAARVLDRTRMADGTAKIVLQGMHRIHLAEIVATRPYFRAKAIDTEEPTRDSPEVRGLAAEVLRLVGQLVEADERYPDELRKAVQLNAKSGSRCADFVADKVNFGYEQKRRVLETSEVALRLGLVAELLQREIARAKVAGEVQAKTAVTIDRAQRGALLRAQLDVIRRELDVLDPAEKEIAQLERRIEGAALPPPAAEEALREVQRLRQASVRALEGSSIRTHVGWLLAMPWESTTKDRLNLRGARRMLDKRYFGFENAKRRLLEFLAVRKLGAETRAPVLGIVGPPGSGRTSLARTVADILGRRFVRIAMQGVEDEAEIHGVPRAHVAARPSALLEGLRQAGTRNPVVLIDDIDQAEGEPVSAVVEAVDPKRNHRFHDRYLTVPFDLSRVLFVLTAHVEDYLPEALWDRLTVVELPGYTEVEKLTIAREYVWPEVMEEHGLKGQRVRLSSAGLRRMIQHYTREAGMSELREQFSKICRRVAVQVATGGDHPPTIHTRNLSKYLGPPVYTQDPVAREPQIGAAMGLAWTDEGGDLLPIEALLMPGEGNRILTGRLGEVMQESVSAALSYVRSRAEELGIAADTFKKNDLHIHFPETAIAKDGPSAGITVATTIASLLSGRPVRHDVAMTGEISLRGKVLPVGSIREKLLAAHRAHIRHVILPKGNESDLADVPREVSAKLRLHLVEEVSEVFRIALRGARKRG
jgi:ATP-dependent Lon protease